MSKNTIWGQETEKNLKNFKIGNDVMPKELLKGILTIKIAAAKANVELKVLDKAIGKRIEEAALKIIKEENYEFFPLSVWQTGSGTHTNMNVNEVLAVFCEKEGFKVHPNDHVNMSQSSNDVFPSAMHVAAYTVLNEKLIPEVKRLEERFLEKEKEYKDILKLGRTHLQDAVPLTFGQELSAYKEMMKRGRRLLLESLKDLSLLPLGGTAVGTGLNAPKGFSKKVVENLSKVTGYPFKESKNKFYEFTSKGAMVQAHGSIKALACDLLKISNDIKLLASGPNGGLSEIKLPENEKGSSIMPGKVNPTQAEALSMVCLKVMGNDTSISMASSLGILQLNTYMPLIIHNFLESVNLLADSIKSFNDNCIKGMTIDAHRMREHLENSLMVVTALAPVIGYEAAENIVKYGREKKIPIREACLKFNIMKEEDLDKLLDFKKMV